MRDIPRPLIADEIQTGMYRTGRLLASHAYGIEPDYLMLGKSLGGGLVKIAALLVRAERYQEDFGLLHTSTFAEDDLSSRVALRTLELLDADTGIGMRAERFECQVREGLARIERAFPGVVADVRGKGFLMGVELAPGIAGRSALVTDYLGESGLTTYAYAGYLLHRHGVRVAPTLNAHRTMRLEPCAWISEPSVRRVLEALHDLASKIHGGRLHAITAHLWAGTPDFESPIVSKPRPPAPRVRAGTRKVTFLSHLISMDEGAGLDPMMAAIGSDDRQRLFDHLWPMAPPIVFHEQEIEGPTASVCSWSFAALARPRPPSRIRFAVAIVWRSIGSRGACSTRPGPGRRTSGSASTRASSPTTAFWLATAGSTLRRGTASRLACRIRRSNGCWPSADSGSKTFVSVWSALPATSATSTRSWLPARPPA